MKKKLIILALVVWGMYKLHDKYEHLLPGWPTEDDAPEFAAKKKYQESSERSKTAQRSAGWDPDKGRTLSESKLREKEKEEREKKRK